MAANDEEKQAALFWWVDRDGDGVLGRTVYERCHMLLGHGEVDRRIVGQINTNHHRGPRRRAPWPEKGLFLHESNEGPGLGVCVFLEVFFNCVTFLLRIAM